MSSELDDAFDEFVASVAESARAVRTNPFYADAENRASAYAFLASMMLSRLEEDVVFDADDPYFRILDPRIREGGDNPDQRYLIASLRGGETYRIWGQLGAARRLDFQIYAGNPYIPGDGGRSASYLNFEDMTFGPDGSFSVLASPKVGAGVLASPMDGGGEQNWLENPADATRILVRQVYSDWNDADPGHVHIDRVGHEGDSKPRLTESDMAQRYRKASASLVAHVNVWPTMVNTNYLTRVGPNRISPPFDPGTVGGVPGRWMSSGSWDLADDEALVITTWPSGGNYQGIQLADLWFSSLEYANRQTSLSADQAALDDDGAYRFVIAGSDPGVANWLDTMGRARGVVLLRFDGTERTTFDMAEHPQTAVVKLAELDAVLPATTARVNVDQRRVTIATRRRHVQRRFGF